MELFFPYLAVKIMDINTWLNISTYIELSKTHVMSVLSNSIQSFLLMLKSNLMSELVWKTYEEKDKIIDSFIREYLFKFLRADLNLNMSAYLPNQSVIKTAPKDWILDLNFDFIWYWSIQIKYDISENKIYNDGKNDAINKIVQNFIKDESDKMWWPNIVNYKNIFNKLTYYLKDNNIINQGDIVNWTYEQYGNDVYFFYSINWDYYCYKLTKI
jgi:hypothetical protein